MTGLQELAFLSSPADGAYDVPSQTISHPKVVGIYRKLHLVVANGSNSLEAGMTPDKNGSNWVRCKDDELSTTLVRVKTVRIAKIAGPSFA
jgi:hypothetical protein